MEPPVVFFHGFDKDSLFKLVEAVKAAAKETGLDPASIAFASSTVNNMEWKIRKLVREVRKEHEHLNRET
jgi:hypothetical protein